MLSKRRIILTNLVLMGVLAALATGIAIGVQSTLSSRIGGLIGSFKTGVLMNATGGLIAILIFITLLLVKGKGFWQTPGTAIIMLIFAGALGILIVTGVSFSIQKTGVAVAMATLILGEMVLSIIVDAKGWAGAPPIPISWSRILGLLVIAAGIYLLLPKKS